MSVLSEHDLVPRRDVPPLADDEIHLWHARVDTSSAKAEREDARALLRRLLGAYAGTACIEIDSGEHGKPFANGGIEFNLSHSGGEVAIAFARAQALGVDIERTQRRHADSGEIAQRFFHPREAAALERLPPAQRALAFLRLWTHKEAVLKAIGHGLSFGLDRLEFALDDAGGVRGLCAIADEAGAPSRWRLMPFAFGAHAVGCVAWHGDARRLRAFAWAP